MIYYCDTCNAKINVESYEDLKTRRCKCGDASWTRYDCIEKNPLQTQEGGDHYRKMKIQPMEFFAANQTPGPEAVTVRYILRHRGKNGLEDLKKAKHCIELMMELYYGEDRES